MMSRHSLGNRCASLVRMRNSALLSLQFTASDTLKSAAARNSFPTLRPLMIEPLFRKLVYSAERETSRAIKLNRSSSVSALSNPPGMSEVVWTLTFTTCFFGNVTGCPLTSFIK